MSRGILARHAYEAFENPDARIFVIANNILALATVASVVAIILETVHGFAAYHLIFKTVEYTAAFLFSIEYIGRFLVARSKAGYVFSFFGIIDLLAILPTFLAVANFTFLKTSRALRILRFLRMLRLAKLARSHYTKRSLHSVYFLNIQIYVVALVTALTLLGGILYFFEGNHEYARDLPSAMYWVFKAILGGISFPQPATIGGTVVLIAARFTSMILLGIMLALVGTMLRKALTGSETDA